MTTSEQNPTLIEELTYCAVHPDRETGLQCNKCGRYMCVDCAVRTPVGYRCRECVRGIEDKFFNARPSDGMIVFAVCSVLGIVAGFLIRLVPFLLFAILLAAPAGGAISEAALRLTGRRRGRQTAIIAAAGTAVGCLAPLLVTLLLRGRLVPDISLLLFAAIATAAVFGRFKMRI